MKTAHHSLVEIGRRQNLARNLHRQLAARCFYRVAKRWQIGGSSLALVLALAAPIVFFALPSAGPILGALAGLWVFVSRLFVVPMRNRSRLRGAVAQEMFDCDVLGLPWNRSLARPLAEEEIRGMCGDDSELDRIRNWYPAKGDASWPLSVLICQRSNAVWSRRQHHDYSIVLSVMAAGWFGIGVVVALVGHATLASYLTTIALPSLPALLDASDLATSHSVASKRRGELEETLDDLREIPPEDERPLREIQDELLGLRRDEPLVPEWFYKLKVSAYERDMRYGAESMTGASDDGDDS